MRELIVTVRYQAESARSFRASRCGVTWKESGELKSVVFNSSIPNYSVRITDIDEPEFRMAVSHIFVERWAKLNKLPDWYQCWRTHVDVWPAREEAPFAYVKPIREEPYGHDIHRYAFEHVGGPQYITPEFLTMELSSGSIPEAVCNVNLIPERAHYEEDCELMYHPGCYPGFLGMLGFYEDILVRHRAPQVLHVM